MNIAFEHQVKTGVFGADMYIEMVNHGPVTILIDSKNKEYRFILLLLSMNLLTEKRLEEILNKQRVFFKSHATKSVA